MLSIPNHMILLHVCRNVLQEHLLHDFPRDWSDPVQYLILWILILFYWEWMQYFPSPSGQAQPLTFLADYQAGIVFWKQGQKQNWPWFVMVASTARSPCTHLALYVAFIQHIPTVFDSSQPAYACIPLSLFINLNVLFIGYKVILYLSYYYLGLVIGILGHFRLKY